MNIKQAREQLELTVKAYLQKNAFGEYEIPVQKQRPVFLIGAPGIGKTAIVEQVSSALGIGLLSYQAYLRTNSGPALEQCIAARDIQMLKCFCARKIPQREAVEAALRETLSKHMVEFTAVLTAYRNTFREQSVFEKMMELSLP